MIGPLETEVDIAKFLNLDIGFPPQWEYGGSRKEKGEATGFQRGWKGRTNHAVSSGMPLPVFLDSR